MPRIVLYQPEIPPNTGNVARTCAATGSELHLIEPLGFEISDRQLKRAGLDYWPWVRLHRHASLPAFLRARQQQGRGRRRRQQAQAAALVRAGADGAGGQALALVVAGAACRAAARGHESCDP